MRPLNSRVPLVLTPRARPIAMILRMATFFVGGIEFVGPLSTWSYLTVYSLKADIF